MAYGRKRRPAEADRGAGGQTEAPKGSVEHTSSGCFISLKRSMVHIQPAKNQKVASSPSQLHGPCRVCINYRGSPWTNPSM